MVSLIDKYINMVRMSKLKTAIVSLCFAILCLGTSYTYRDTTNGLDNKESMIVCLMSSIVLGIVWFISSLVLVKISDNIEERKAAERRAELEKRKEKSEARLHKKINNKKKKKNKTVSK